MLTQAKIKSKPAKPAKPAPILAGQPLESVQPASADKRAAYLADYQSAKMLYAILVADSTTDAADCPIKPAAYKAAQLPLLPKAHAASLRGAACIYAAIACQALCLADGTTYSRRFTIGHVNCVIERGCASDFIGTLYTSDATRGNGNESFTLLPGATAAIESALGQARIKAAQAYLAALPRA